MEALIACRRETQLSTLKRTRGLVRVAVSLGAHNRVVLCSAQNARPALQGEGRHALKLATMQIRPGQLWELQLAAARVIEGWAAGGGNKQQADLANRAVVGRESVPRVRQRLAYLRFVEAQRDLVIWNASAWMRSKSGVLIANNTMERFGPTRVG